MIRIISEYEIKIYQRSKFHRHADRNAGDGSTDIRRLDLRHGIYSSVSVARVGSILPYDTRFFVAYDTLTI